MNNTVEHVVNVLIYRIANCCWISAFTEDKMASLFYSWRELPDVTSICPGAADHSHSNNHVILTEGYKTLTKSPVLDIGDRAKGKLDEGRVEMMNRNRVERGIFL